MNVEDFRAYCLSLPFVEEYTPFDEVTLCFKVGGIEHGKIFALLSLDAVPSSANLKYPSEEIEDLRSAHPQIVPGYHMNKKHWNTVYIEDGLSHKMVRSLIDHSYSLVYQSLTVKYRKELEASK